MSGTLAHRYSLYGRVWASGVEMAFREADDEAPEVEFRRRPDWVGEVEDDDLGRYDGESVAVEYAGWRFRLDASESVVGWAEGSDDWELDVPFDHAVERLVAPVYEMIADEGVVCLHGSAVVVDGGGWVVTGSSSSGKSTSAYLLRTSLGGRFASDEMAVLDVRNGMLRPGAPVMRLRPSVVGEVDEATESGTIHPELDKRWYRFPLDASAVESAPIGGIVVLEPSDEVGDAQVEVLRGGDAATSLLEEAFDFPGEAPVAWKRRRFESVVTLAREHDVMRITYPDEPGDPSAWFEELREVVSGEGRSATDDET